PWRRLPNVAVPSVAASAWPLWRCPKAHRRRHVAIRRKHTGGVGCGQQGSAVAPRSCTAVLRAGGTAPGPGPAADFSNTKQLVKKSSRAGEKRLAQRQHHLLHCTSRTPLTKQTP